MNWLDALATKRRIRPARPFEKPEAWMAREEERVTEALDWEVEPTMDLQAVLSTLELAIKTINTHAAAFSENSSVESALLQQTLVHVRILTKRAVEILEGCHE
jgi:hypothetical protein